MSETTLMYMVCGIIIAFMLVGAAGLQVKKKRNEAEGR